MRRTLENLAEARKRKEDLFREESEKLERRLAGETPDAREIRDVLASLLNLVRRQSELADARDREWDALASNHVAMIFKSMEWRVDKLAAESADANILLKKLFLLREKLDTLLNALEGAAQPSPETVRAVLGPLEDWRYAGFENRFRGYEEEVRRQQGRYLPLFRKGGAVLDLGCGRGEFLELLRDNGITGEGVDLNGQMVDICLDKGLVCEQGDLFEKLAWKDNGSLAGVFSSQVIEHLPPAYLKRLVETAFLKLEPGGVLVLETVNPTSVFALVQIFFLDLSHQKPIHPQALRFLVESFGYEDVKILFSDPLGEERLRTLPGADESSALLNANIDALNRLLFGPPNYAVTGRKT